MRKCPIFARAILVAAAVCIAAAAGCDSRDRVPSSIPTPGPSSHCPSSFPIQPNYVGIFVRGFPPSTTPLTQFENATSVRPNLITFYPRFGEKFQASAACTAIRRGATPVIQIDPVNTSLARIAAGRFDAYLRSYALSVKQFGAQLILSFGHEMNGSWYSWGYRHTPPSVFTAAWRHIFTVFRAVGASNVTWLWTINVINDTQYGRIPNPAPWWPGRSYVDWVGIDGYYFKASWRFASLFGPTITAVHRLTHDPILISETGAASAAQAQQIDDLFTGIHQYGLIGLVWFDATGSRDWRINQPAAIAAFRQGTEKTNKNLTP